MVSLHVIAEKSIKIIFYEIKLEKKVELPYQKSSYNGWIQTASIGACMTRISNLYVREFAKLIAVKIRLWKLNGNLHFLIYIQSQFLSYDILKKKQNPTPSKMPFLQLLFWPFKEVNCVDSIYHRAVTASNQP